MKRPLPAGKLPPDLMARLLAQAPILDSRVLLGPGVGLDCAVLEFGPHLLVLKTDPITLASDEIGWYAVQVNANDIATSGAEPRWFLATLLLPEGQTTSARVERIGAQLFRACRELSVSLIGGHTEITPGLDRPILCGTMIGEVARERLVTPRGASPGDALLLTKEIPIEAVSILAREQPDQLASTLNPDELRQAQNYLYTPGISVVKDARLALQAGRVTAMHDPTEGGLAGALWELAEASGRALRFDPQAVPISPLAARVCQVFGVDPLAAIASGALLLTAPSGEARKIQTALREGGIPCAVIGGVEEGPAAVWQPGEGGRIPLPRPARDEIARIGQAGSN